MYVFIFNGYRLIYRGILVFILGNNWIRGYLDGVVIYFCGECV